MRETHWDSPAGGEPHPAVGLALLTQAKSRSGRPAYQAIHTQATRPVPNYLPKALNLW